MRERAKDPAQSGTDRGDRSKRKHLDQLLDQALEDTFPASDPVAVLQPAPDLPPDDDDAGDGGSGTPPSRASPP